MSLLKPGLGDLIDRLTILELKLEHYDEPLDHFREERSNLVKVINLELDNLPASATRAEVEELEVIVRNVNTAIWKEEDHLRRQRIRFERASDMTREELLHTTESAMAIQRENELRAHYVHRINIIADDVDPNQREKQLTKPESPR